MSDATYAWCVGTGKVLVWLSGEVRTPPFSKEARIEAGGLLRRLQDGETLTMPHSKPMGDVGPNSHELRVPDGDLDWRIMYAIRLDAIVILEVFSKKTRKTSLRVLETCRDRLKRYAREAGEKL